MAMTETASSDLPLSPALPRTRIRSPGCKSSSARGAAFFRSVDPGSARTTRAASWTITVISPPDSGSSVMFLPATDFTVPTDLAEDAACPAVGAGPASCARAESGLPVNTKKPTRAAGIAKRRSRRYLELGFSLTILQFRVFPEKTAAVPTRKNARMPYRFRRIESIGMLQIGLD